jgi:hypothetical protein
MFFEQPWNLISTNIAYLLAVLVGLSSILLRTPNVWLPTPQVLSRCARGPVQQEFVEIRFAQSRYLLRICAYHRGDSPQRFAELRTVREKKEFVCAREQEHTRGSSGGKDGLGNMRCVHPCGLPPYVHFLRSFMLHKNEQLLGSGKQEYKLQMVHLRIRAGIWKRCPVNISCK